jgi:PIN domain nuclease of toxin-antitoxin system
VGDPSRLRADARAAIAEDARDVFVSPVALWEISIKQAAGKLEALPELVETLVEEGFAQLPITWEHALVAGALPRHHGDPFDRMLVAQAQLEGLTLATRDPIFERYDVRVLPA